MKILIVPGIPSNMFNCVSVTVPVRTFRRVNQEGDLVSYCSLPCTLYESINK